MLMLWGKYLLSIFKLVSLDRHGSTALGSDYAGSEVYPRKQHVKATSTKPIATRLCRCF